MLSYFLFLHVDTLHSNSEPGYLFTWSWCLLSATVNISVVALRIGLLLFSFSYKLQLPWDSENRLYAPHRLCFLQFKDSFVRNAPLLPAFLPLCPYILILLSSFLFSTAVNISTALLDLPAPSIFLKLSYPVFNYTYTFFWGTHSIHLYCNLLCPKGLISVLGFILLSPVRTPCCCQCCLGKLVMLLLLFVVVLSAFSLPSMPIRLVTSFPLPGTLPLF